jgi:hypothetical protein
LGDVQVRLLGPVDVLAGGAGRTVPGLRRRAVLAMLALHAGEVVETDLLVDAVWATAHRRTRPRRCTTTCRAFVWCSATGTRSSPGRPGTC